MEHGATPDTVREDAPVRIGNWAPENYSHRYEGPVTLRTALAHSLNTVAVRLGQEVGPKTVVQTAQRLGITSPLQANGSIGNGVELATKRYGADPRYQARPTQAAPPLPCTPRPLCCVSALWAPRTAQAYLDATPLLFPTWASLKAALSGGK